MASTNEYEGRTTDDPAAVGCDPSSGCCGPSPSRREFIQLVGLGAVAAVAGARPVVAGPFESADFEKLVPADKKLDPAWVRSLADRGTPTVYRGADLAKIGMPVGGIGAGQLYLGGDGTLWHWDVFNQPHPTGDRHYAEPLKPESPLDQGFAVRLSSGNQTHVRALDHRGFSQISFLGQYPIGRVEYRDPALPIAVILEAFSPFIPLNADDSSLPATVLHFTVKNTGKSKAEVELGGWLENAVCLHTGTPSTVNRVNRVVRRQGLTCLECRAEPAPEFEDRPVRPDVLFEDFEKKTYEGWTATGTAFGAGPIEKAKMPAYQGDVGARGDRLVNTHNVRQGEDVSRGDAHTGTLTSKPFIVERSYVNFLIGGGSHAGKTCLNLVIDGKTVRTATGKNDNRLGPASFDVRDLQGKTARLQIVDDEAGAWGNVGVDEIVFSDQPGKPPLPLRERHDFGTMALAVVEAGGQSRAVAALPDDMVPPGIFAPEVKPMAEASRPFGRKLAGSLARTLHLEPGEEGNVTFVIAWHFPNLRLDGLKTSGRWYATRFGSAVAVAEHVVRNLERLAGRTRLWRDVWYDSTLPHWFLDRTFLNVSTLATSTCHRFGDGRFYGWEGVGCCPGTCTHVWHYAQAMARLFPELERDTRERVDLGISFDPKTGAIDFRGEFRNGEAVDGQAGVVLRCWREHQTSASDAFLKRNWTRIKKALQRLIDQDGNGDGVLEGPQHNTLDAAWFGKIPWLSALYHAALRAGEEMATEMADVEFAGRCRTIFEVGRERLDKLTWKEAYGYYIQVPDPAHLDSVGSFDGCGIDQALGQSWAHQVGLGEVMKPDHVRKALAALWRYNYTPDVGPYRQVHKSGRWYAMAGEGGLLMVTHPFGPGPDFKDKSTAWSAMYFNECMTGFEHQAAAHMIAEGMTTEGLAIERTIHDRYHASRRNPWNEVECGDHYARAMASHGVFLTACGFEHHGPGGTLGFAPKIHPEDFRAPFTAAEGWGTYAQRLKAGSQRSVIDMRSGTLRLSTLSLVFAGDRPPRNALVERDGGPINAKVTFKDQRVVVNFDRPLRLKPGEVLSVTVGG